MKRVLVVPWSIAPTYVAMLVSLGAAGDGLRRSWGPAGPASRHGRAVGSGEVRSTSSSRGRGLQEVGEDGAAERAADDRACPRLGRATTTGAARGVARYRRGVDLLAPLPRPRVMGVVNVTPDSFSDGGRFLRRRPPSPTAGGCSPEGADILDVGGESTRPGATRPLVPRRCRRVIPVIAALAAAGAVVSVDTMRAEVAAGRPGRGRHRRQRRLRRAGRPRDPRRRRGGGATYVAMHWRAHSDRMADHARYDGPGGVVAAVRDELAAAGGGHRWPPGSRRDRSCSTPGSASPSRRRAQLGAAARPGRRCAALGLPLLVGASRKSFLGTLLAEPADPADPRRRVRRGRVGPRAREPPCTVLLAERGVWGLPRARRRAARDALAVVATLDRPSRGATHERRAGRRSGSSASATTASSTSSAARARPS